MPFTLMVFHLSIYNAAGLIKDPLLSYENFFFFFFFFISKFYPGPIYRFCISTGLPVSPAYSIMTTT